MDMDSASGLLRHGVPVTGGAVKERKSGFEHMSACWYFTEISTKGAHGVGRDTLRLRQAA